MKSIGNIFSLVVLLCLLSGCGESNTIDLVKKGTLQFDTSTTIGNVFDSYKYFKSRKWSSFQDGQKRTIVQFEAEVDKEAVFEAAKQVYILQIRYPAEKYVTGCLEKKECPLHSIRTYLTIQFTIMPGDTFQVTHVGTRMNDGEPLKHSPDACFSALYSGKLFVGMGMIPGFGTQCANLAYEWIEAKGIDVFN